MLNAPLSGSAHAHCCPADNLCPHVGMWAAGRVQKPEPGSQRGRTAHGVAILRWMPLEQELETQDREIMSVRAFQRQSRLHGAALSVPVVQEKQIHFPKLHASVYIIGITHPPPSARQASIVLALCSAVSIMLTNCL